MTPYFLANSFFFQLSKQEVLQNLIISRRQRAFVKSFGRAPVVRAGDILHVFFLKRGLILGFEGLCLAVRGKNFQSPNTTLILRNYVQKIGIEVCFCYYYSMAFAYTEVQDFKRKFFTNKRSKFFYIRKLQTLKSRVRGVAVVFER